MLAQTSQLIYDSGAWEIDLARRELRMRGMPVVIGSRAFEILETLVQSAGELVTKDDLIHRVWRGAIVEDNRIQVHISAIRKALGADRGMLKTHSGRGYRLLGNWRTRHAPAPANSDTPRQTIAAPNLFRTNVPVAASALVGREAAVQHLCDLASAYRAVTLTGPGGIGKSVLAAEVARRLFPEIESDVFLVELISLSDPALVPSTLSGVLGLQLDGGETSPGSIARAIGNKKVLVVLDNCEHVIDAAANLAETLLRMCSDTTVLATSREVLRIDGEFVYRVAPLDVPTKDTSSNFLDYGAVELFLARANASDSGFSPGSEELALIATICRQLDGIPLAIEFAAARAATLGVQQVAGRLDDRLALFTSGRRTALPRHQTLRATLDWSYELLSEEEQRLLRNLAVFPGSFTLEAARAVMSDTLPVLATGISNLISKSLVALDELVSVRRWRLLETTRVYAREKLEASGESISVVHRHAEYYREFFARAEAEVLVRPRREWLADYAWEIDNLRSALDWAFSPGGGDVSVGIALTTAAVPLWVYLSLIEECRDRVERALDALAAAKIDEPWVEMKLQAALGASLTWVRGAVPEIEAAWGNALQLAERLGDVDHQLRALWGLWLLKDQEALTLAQQFLAVAITPVDRLHGERMIGVSNHYLGNQNIARRHIERVVSADIAQDSGSRIIHFQIDLRLAAGAFLARILWLQGFPEQAMHTAESLVEDARAANHAHSLCHGAAIAACPIALWVGNLDLAEYYVDLLRDYSTTHAPARWGAVGRAHRGVLLVKRGDLEAGLNELRAAFEECRVVPTGYRVLVFLAELAEALGRAGQASEGLATAQEALDHAEVTVEGWIIAELLRVKGELLLLGEAAAAEDAAERCFLQALHLAQTQGALAWELRAATSLAKLHQAQSRPAEAIACLQPTYNRFTEGFDSADLIAAKALLIELSAA